MNYVVRKAVDASFIDSLARDKHIVIYGSSKQGKTCLRKHCLRDSDYITVHCSNKWSLADLHANILKRAGYELTVTSTVASSGNRKLSAKFGAAIGGVGIGVEGGKETGTQTEVVTKSLELDADDVNDVIAALEQVKFGQFIVLEDFHYLPTETQKQFSVSLKALHENSRYTFIIIGVWLEENRLSVYNGDLTGRITAINADAWSSDELQEVIKAGEVLLNIEFPEEFCNQLIDASQGSVYVLQEACYMACTNAGFFHTADQLTAIGAGVNVAELVKSVVDQSKGRYNSFLVSFADGFQTTNLELYRWLLLPVLITPPSELEKGLRLSQINKYLTANHPHGGNLNPGSVTQALQYSASLQVKKDIKPIVLDYDQSNLRLNVVDRGFLIWLRYQRVKDLLDLIGLPEPKKEGLLEL